MSSWEGITQNELDDIRAVQLSFMPDAVTVKRRRWEDGENYYDIVGTAITARIMPGFGFWRDVADRFQGITAYTVTVPWDTDVRAGDLILDAENRAYEVRDVRVPSSYQTAKQMLADGVTDG